MPILTDAARLLILALAYFGAGVALIHLCNRFTETKLIPTQRPVTAMIIGMATHLLIGGWLLALGLAHSATLCAVVGVFSGLGVIALAVSLYQSRQLLLRNRFLGLIIVVSILVLVVGRIICTNFGINYSTGDDYLAYIDFVKSIVETGTLIEPFNLRRLVNLGGQSYLLAQWYALSGKLDGLYQLEYVLATLLYSAFFIEQVLIERPASHFRPRHLSAILVFAVLLMYIEIFSINLAGAFTILILTAALARFMLSDARVPICYAAICAASLVTIRSIYLPIIVLVFFFSQYPVTARRLPTFKDIRKLLPSLAIFLLALMPWCITMYRSSETFLYPFMKGNYVLVNDLLSGSSAVFLTRELWTTYISLLGNSNFILAVLLVIVVSTLIPVSKFSYLVSSLTALSAGIVVTCLSLPTSDHYSLMRYISPMVEAIFFVVFIEIIDLDLQSWIAAFKTSRLPMRLLSAAVAVLTCIHVAQLWEGLYQGVNTVLQKSTVEHYPRVFFANNNLTLYTANFLTDSVEQAEYRTIDDQLPSGSRSVVAVDKPFLLNRTNKSINTLDWVNHCAPGGRPYLGETWLDMAKYFEARGYTHLVVTDSLLSTNMYAKVTWELDDVERVKALAIGKPNLQKFIGYVDQLFAEHTATIQTETMRIYELKMLINEDP